MRALAKLDETTRAAVVALLRGYKFAISPLSPPACRYVPSCSEYAIEAVDRHGVLRGSVLAILRLLRCHPFVKGGFDPVPLNDSCSGGPPGPPLMNEVAGRTWTAAPTRACHH